MPPPAPELLHLHTSSDGRNLFHTDEMFPTERFDELRKRGIKHIVTVSDHDLAGVEIAAVGENLKAVQIMPTRMHAAESLKDLQELGRRWKSGGLLIHVPHRGEKYGVRGGIMAYRFMRATGATSGDARASVFKLVGREDGERINPNDPLARNIGSLESMGKDAGLW